MGRLKEELIGRFAAKENEFKDEHFDDAYHYQKEVIQKNADNRMILPEMKKFILENLHKRKDFKLIVDIAYRLKIPKGTNWITEVNRVMEKYGYKIFMELKSSDTQWRGHGKHTDDYYYILKQL